MTEPTGARRVLVTGGSRGIGAAVCRAFAGAGDTVAVHFGHDGATAEDVRAALPGLGHVTVGGDLRDPDAVRRLVDEAAARLGGLDVVVNNAGVFVTLRIEELDYAAWQQAWADTLSLNLVAAANVCFCALPHLPRDGRGRIVNVASRGAFRGEPTSPAYGASKAGLVALGQSLAKALGGHGIAVSTVAPGFVLTDMSAARLQGEEGARRAAESPMNRVGTPEEVAAAVLYLASGPAQWASGAVLDLNGASYLRM